MGTLTLPLDRQAAFSRLFGRLRLYWKMIKDLQTGLLVLTAAAGYISGCCLNLRGSSLLQLVGSLFLAVSGTTVLNMIYDRDIDARMARTARRPLPGGLVSVGEALGLALLLTLSGLAWAFWMDALYGLVVFGGVLLDFVVYTVWLKRRSPYSIIIGGLAGGMPALAGRVLAVGTVDLVGSLLALGVLLWIPTHIMTFNIKHAGDYRAAGIPTFPAMYGVGITRLIIAASTILSVGIMLAVGGLIHLEAGYQVGLAVLGLVLIGLTLAGQVWKRPTLNFVLYKGASIYMLGAMILIILGGF